MGNTKSTVQGAHEGRAIDIEQCPTGACLTTRLAAGGLGNQVALDKAGISELIAALQEEEKRLSDEPVVAEGRLIWPAARGGVVMAEYGITYGAQDGVPFISVCDGDRVTKVPLGAGTLRELIEWGTGELERLDRLEPLRIADNDGDILELEFRPAVALASIGNSHSNCLYGLDAAQSRKVAMWLNRAADKLDAREKAK